MWIVYFIFIKIGIAYEILEILHEFVGKGDIWKFCVTLEFENPGRI